MPSLLEAQNILVAQAQAALPDVSLVFDNMDGERFSSANPPQTFVRVMVHMDRNIQMGLGNRLPRRQYGELGFLIHTPWGIGAQEMLDLKQRLTDHFQGNCFDGIELGAASDLLRAGKNGNWYVSSIIFGFYFEQTQ